MRVALLAVTVGFAAAAAGYALGVVLAALLARGAMRRGSQAALAVRLLPFGLAVVASVALVVPGFVIHEPADGEALPGLVAALLASAGLVLAGSVARRGWNAWRATRRVLEQWEASAQPVTMPSGPAPAFRIAHPFPVVAVVGVFRPRLFVARSVLHELTPAELSAVLEHEAAHVRARDNVKRWLMACAPAVGWRHTALALERAWEDAAEHDADRSAQGALELASALVKTARMAPHGVQLRIPAAAFHGGGDVARRVKDLVAGSPGPDGRTHLRTIVAAAVVTTLVAVPLLWPVAFGFAESLIHLP